MSSSAQSALVALVVSGLIAVIWFIIAQILHSPQREWQVTLPCGTVETGTQTEKIESPAIIPCSSPAKDINVVTTNKTNMSEVAMHAVMEWRRRVSTHSISDSGIGGSELGDSPPASVKGEWLSRDVPRGKTRRPSVSSTYSTFSTKSMPADVVNEAVEKAKILKERRELKRRMQTLERANNLKSMVESVEAELERIRKRRTDDKFLPS